MLRILLIAPIGSGTSASNVIGGNKVTAVQLIHELARRSFEVNVLDTSGSVTNLTPWKVRAFRLARFLLVVWGVVKNIRHAQVVFLVIAPYSATVVASTVWTICKIARRPMVLSLSGSGLSVVYRRYGALARWLADRTWMHCALVYVETQQTYRDFSDRTNFRRLPNTRNVAPPAADRREEPSVGECKRGSIGMKKIGKLIFLSRLHMDKGLAETLEACRHLPEGSHLQVFGPRMAGTDSSLFAGHPHATYGGILEPHEVPRVLREHDLLLFPSYCDWEGYPGVIIEAFQCGLPVVAAKWGGVTELVEHEENGLLVEPRSAIAVKSAIERLMKDPSLYQRLCKGAKRRGEDFRSTDWYGRLASDLRDLCGM